jgi:CRISPR-associated protein Csm3
MNAALPEPASLRLDHYLVVTGTIQTLSGLHIGASKDDLEIGGTDLPVIAHPFNQEPYIPGSSLKGKLRSLLELKYGRYGWRYDRQANAGSYGANGEPCGCGREDCPVCPIFGPHKNTNHKLGPTRLLVRDAPLTPESRQILASNPRVDQANPFVGLKSENSIDRKTGVASNPRTQEVVPAGVDFALELCLRVFQTDDAEAIWGKVWEAIRMLQMDALGAGGSRGGGKVKITVDRPQIYR